MGCHQRVGSVCLVGLWILGISHVGSRAAYAQWKDPKLIAGQVGFHVAVSFVGKLVVERESPGRAIKQALKEGAFSGLTAHAGYTLAGHNPNWSLVGKTLAQKANLTTRRSVQGLPVFDASLYSHWEITHSFVHFRWDGRPQLSLDAINAAFSAYYLFSSHPYELDAKRTLLSGSLVFLNHNPPERVRGYYVPGVIWIDASTEERDRVLAHEVIHSFQAERGTSIHEWNYRSLRLNWLVVASGVPAFLAGWPDHDDRLHEQEANRYAGTE